MREEKQVQRNRAEKIQPDIPAANTARSLAWQAKTTTTPNRNFAVVAVSVRASWEKSLSLMILMVMADALLSKLSGGGGEEK